MVCAWMETAWDTLHTVLTSFEESRDINKVINNQSSYIKHNNLFQGGCVFPEFQRNAIVLFQTNKFGTCHVLKGVMQIILICVKISCHSLHQMLWPLVLKKLDNEH